MIFRKILTPSGFQQYRALDEIEVEIEAPRVVPAGVEGLVGLVKKTCSSNATSPGKIPTAWKIAPLSSGNSISDCRGFGLGLAGLVFVIWFADWLGRCCDRPFLEKRLLTSTVAILLRGKTLTP